MWDSPFLRYVYLTPPSSLVSLSRTRYLRQSRPRGVVLIIITFTLSGHRFPHAVLRVVLARVPLRLDRR
jgi:hypothetical protein